MRVSSAFSRRVAAADVSDSKRTALEPSPRPSAVLGGLKAQQAVARPSLRLTPSDANLFDVLHSRHTATSLNRDINRRLVTHAAFIHDLSFDQLLEGHAGCVNRLAWNQSATLLASGSDDRCVRLWSFTQPDRPCRLNLQTGHQANIFAVGFLQSDASIVSAGMDCSVRVCRIDREECIGVYNCHQARVKELCVDPANDNVFLTAGEDGTCRQFDMREPHHCGAAATGRGRRMFMHREFSSTAPCANALISTPSLQAKCVDINPLLPQYVLLSANDHYIRVFDRRYLPPSHLSTASVPAYARFAASHLKRGHQSTFSQWDETGRQIVASYSGEQVYVYEFDRRADEEEGSKYRAYSKSGERAEEELKRQFEEEHMEEVEVDAHLTPPQRTSTLPTLNLDTAFPTRIAAANSTFASSAAPPSSAAALPPDLVARAEQLTAQGDSEYERKDYSAAIASYNSALLIVTLNQPALTSRILTLRSAALTARNYPSDLHLALDDAMQAYRVDRQNERALVAAVDCQRKLGRLSRAMRLCQYGMMHVRDGAVEREMNAMMDEMREERKKRQKEYKKAAESKAAGARGRRREQREKAKEKVEERKHRRTKRSKSSAAAGLTVEEKEREKERELRERKRRKARTESEDEVRAMETEVTSTEETEEKRRRRMNRGKSEERKERGGRAGKEEKEREEKSPAMADDAFDELMMDTLRMTREQWMAKYGDDEDEEEADPISDNEHDVDGSLVDEEELDAAEEAEEEGEDNLEEDDGEDVSMSDLEQAQEAELVEAIARRRPARRVADKEHETSSQSTSSLSDTPAPPPQALPAPAPTAPPSSATSLPPHRTRVHRTFLQRYLGHANVQTDIKESTFWGPYILSGSDDGHVFIWERSSARLVCVIKASDDVINCTAAGTLIALGDGTSVPIEEVQPGSAVLSYVAAGPEEGSTEGLAVMRVDELMDRGERQCVELLFDDKRTLVCTPDHRIRTADGRWVEAGQLVEGADEVAVERLQLSPTFDDPVEDGAALLEDDEGEDGDTDPYVYPAVDKVRYGVHRDGRVLPLFRVKLVRRREVGVRNVYDLSVPNSRSDDHRSFVANGIVVHNCVRGHPYSSVIASSGIDSEIHVWSVKPRRVREEGEQQEADRPRADGRGQVDKDKFVQLVDGNQRRMQRDDASLSPSTLLSLILQSLGRHGGADNANPLAILQMLNTGEVVIRPARGGGTEEEEEEDEDDEEDGEEGAEDEDDDDEEDGEF